MRYSKKNGYRNKYGLTRYEQKQLNSYNKSLKINNKQNKFSSSGVHSKFNNNSVGLFGIFIMVLLFIVLFNYLRTGNFINFTFKSLIDFLASAPDIDTSWSIIDLTIHGDWGFFDFFRTFLNWFTSIYEVIAFLFGMIIESLGFIWYFFKYLFFVI